MEIIDRIREAGPYRNVRFMATGGINPQNLAEYLACDAIVACGGSWILSKEALANKDYAQVTRVAKEAVDIVRKVRK